MGKRNRKSHTNKPEQGQCQKLEGWKTGAANFKYKDTVFRMLFREKERLLDLYNAIAGKHYTNPEELEIVTLENAVYMEMKNDLAFLISLNLYLFEHQSTVNENMPLRFLQYVTAEYSKLTVLDNLYAEKLVRIPAPHFVVFYNGTAPYPEEKLLKLSDAFRTREDDPELELRVRVLNINATFNEGLKAQCQTLGEYMQYVDKVRGYARDMPIGMAVDRAIDECINAGVLKEFLARSRAEVRRMSIFEYDEEATRKAISANAYERGVADGVKRGISQGISAGELRKLIFQICKKMKKNKNVDQIAEELEEERSIIEMIFKMAMELEPDDSPQLVYERFMMTNSVYW